MRKVSMLDIANELGISKVSVSKALSDKEGVSEELREKVKALAIKRGYRFNNSARSLKTSRQYNVGILISEKYVMDQESYYFSICGEVIKKLDSVGNSGILEIIKEETEKNGTLPRAYNENKVDGVIVLGQLSNKYLEDLEQMDIPLVYVDFYIANQSVDSIVVDNFYSGYRITDLLVDKGHKKIGFVGSIDATSSIQDRYLGYQKALIENNLELNNDFIIADRDQHGILKDLVLPKELPTAFVANCDRVAFALIQKLKSEGIKVPEDCSVVGFDNSLFSTLSYPQITTVDNNSEKMVNLAVKIISKKIDNPNRSYDRLLVTGSIIMRDSVSDIK